MANVLGTLAGGIISFGIYIELTEQYWRLPGAWLGYIENHLIVVNSPFNTPFLGGMLVGSLLISWGEQVMSRRHTHLNIPCFRATACGFLIGVALVFIQAAVWSL